MNRTDFMRQLESLLQDISIAERESALEYYNDYFNDAGPENEQAVIEALGTPARVAQTIKKELFAGGYGEGAQRKATPGDRAIIEYGVADGAADREESGDKKDGNEKREDYETRYTGSGYRESKRSDYEETAASESGKKKLSGGVIAVIVVLCVLASPVLFSVVAGIASVLFGLLAAWFGVILGFGVAAVILLLMMVFFIVLGFIGIVTSPIGACGLIGGGLVCGGIGLLFLMLTVAMAGGATPAVFHFLVSFVKGCFGRKERNL